MTIASEIQRIKTNIANAYTVCNNKGATMPVTENSANLANCIDSISSGGLLENIMSQVVAGNNPVDISALQLAEQQINNLIAGE